MIQPDTTPLSSRYSMLAINPQKVEVSHSRPSPLLKRDWKIPYHQRDRMKYNWYPLVNVHIAIERSTIITGKTHYFDWALFNSYVRLPEGRCVLARFNFLMGGNHVRIFLNSWPSYGFEKPSSMWVCGKDLGIYADFSVAETYPTISYDIPIECGVESPFLSIKSSLLVCLDIYHSSPFAYKASYKISLSQMLHVLNIYLHVGHFGGRCR